MTPFLKVIQYHTDWSLLVYRSSFLHVQTKPRTLPPSISALSIISNHAWSLAFRRVGSHAGQISSFPRSWSCQAARDAAAGGPGVAFVVVVGAAGLSVGVGWRCSCWVFPICRVGLRPRLGRLLSPLLSVSLSTSALSGSLKRLVINILHHTHHSHDKGVTQVQWLSWYSDDKIAPGPKP